MDVLVIDVGGSHVKVGVGGQPSRRFDSGTDLTPHALVEGVHGITREWSYDAISLGLPACVNADGVAEEPGNLGEGWIGFDFEQAFARPVRVVNDAVLQALGAYDGGRMLFMGLGTGLGTALVTEHVVVPLELGDLPFGSGHTMAERLGRAGFEANGMSQWLHDLQQATQALRRAFSADYLVLGGGNAANVDPLPEGTRRGGNEDAFTGGIRLWEEMVEPHDRKPPAVWRVVR